MGTQFPLFAALPSAVLDITTDCMPLLAGLIIGLCCGVLALAFVIGVYDCWWTQPSTQQPTQLPPCTSPLASTLPGNQRRPSV